MHLLELGPVVVHLPESTELQALYPSHVPVGMFHLVLGRCHGRAILDLRGARCTVQGAAVHRGTEAWVHALVQGYWSMRLRRAQW